MDSEQPDWTKGTWEGSRKEQLARWRALPFADKIRAVEALTDFSAHVLSKRKAEGKPYIDPGTGDRIGHKEVTEDKPPYPN